MNEKDFMADAAFDDEKTVEFIKGYLPQELKEKFSDDVLFYFLDVIDEYYAESGVLEKEADEDGFLEINLEEVAKYVTKEAKKNEIGNFEVDDVLFVVQGELEYAESLDQE